MQKANGHANGHSNGLNGKPTSPTRVTFSVGLYEDAYTALGELSNRTGATFQAVASAAVKHYCLSLTKKDLDSLTLENRIGIAQKQLNTLIGQRNGVPHHKQKKGKRKYRKTSSYWAKDGSVA